MPSLKEKLLENWFLKVLAILLAWILWLFVQGEPGTTVSRVDAPVEVQVSQGMEISSEFPSTVQVTMRGARQELKCIINLQNAEEGEHRITLTDDQIKSPKGFGIEVSQINPPQVVLKLEKTESKIVPITIPVQGEPADGFEIYEKIPKPDKVEITGPRSQIEQIDDVSSEIISLNGQNQDANFRVGLNFKDKMVRSSITEPIWVEIRIGPHRQDYFVNGVPLIFQSEDYTVSPEKIDIRVMAPKSMQPTLIPDRFSASIVFPELDDKDFPIKVKPVITFQENWKDKVKLLGTRPAEVTVNLKETASGN